MIRNLIFDVGGTLTRHWRGWTWKDVERNIAAASGVPRDRLEAFFREWGQAGDAVHGLPLREFWPRKTTDITPFTPEQIETALQQFRADLIVPPESIKLLQGLKPRYRLFALTNTWKPGHPKRAELAPHFEAFVQSCDIGARKPNSRAYRYVLEAFGLVPEETLFIDNHLPHIEGAQHVGLRVLQFHDFQQLRADLRVLGVVAAGEGG